MGHLVAPKEFDRAITSQSGSCTYHGECRSLRDERHSPRISPICSSRRSLRPPAQTHAEIPVEPDWRSSSNSRYRHLLSPIRRTPHANSTALRTSRSGRGVQLSLTAVEARGYRHSCSPGRAGIEIDPWPCFTSWQLCNLHPGVVCS